jgi:hypothetical protein
MLARAKKGLKFPLALQHAGLAISLPRQVRPLGKGTIPSVLFSVRWA